MSVVVPPADRVAAPAGHPTSPRDPAVPRRRWLRRAALLAGLGGGTSALEGIRNRVRLAETRHEFAAAPRSGPQRTVRVAHVTDLHLAAIGPLEQRLLERLHASAVDLIAFTGDMIDDADNRHVLDTFLSECPHAPARVSIAGNWEYGSGLPLEEHRRIHERHGVNWLVNRSIVVATPAGRVRVTGLDDLRCGRPDAAAALRDAPPADAHLLLLHCPALCDVPAAGRADLALAGHTHGGQVAPLGFAAVRPRGSGRYVAGWYRDATTPMYVSRGIGTSGLPLRVGAVAELPLIDWSIG